MSKKQITKGPYKEGVVYSEEDLPNDYEPIGHLYEEDKPFHGYICREYSKDRVRRYRVKAGRGNGRMFVHKDDLAMLKAEWESGSNNELSESHLCNESADALKQLHEVAIAIQKTLENLVAAVELLREPRQSEPVGSWRDMNGEVMN